jgi:3-oxoacyl-[acyl-carrier protein] reductase
VPRDARDFSVSDRVVIVTGAGQGIGREFARQYAAAGAIPIIACLRDASLHVIEGGHHVHMERAPEIGALLRDFL